MNVYLRERKPNQSGKITLYLEIYKGYSKTSKGKIKPIRKREKLEYFLYANPKTTNQKHHNKEAKRKAEAIRGRVLNDLINNMYDFTSNDYGKINFIEYFKSLTEARFKSKGNYGNWDSVLKHLKKYAGEHVPFEQVDVKFCEGFKKYLQDEAKTKSYKSLSNNTVSSYFCKLRAALNSAVDDEIIFNNPSKKVAIPKEEEKEIQFLTEEEVKTLYKTECRKEVLKRAFLFSCITGLRWSDIQKLEWSDIHKEGDNWKINFHQKKTKGLQYHPISEQAKMLMGDPVEGHERVFVGLKYSSYVNLELMKWMLKAGITKDITFHSARHSYATLLLTKGKDIYTVSKLMGHRHLKTTQRYAKVVDELKRDAADSLNILLDE